MGLNSNLHIYYQQAEAQTMPSQISTYLVGDSYAPAIPKLSLQQYDNYQIYDLYCLDKIANVNANIWKQQRLFETGGYFLDSYVLTNSDGVQTLKISNYLAVQRYSPHPIYLDFESLVNAHSAVNTTSYIDAAWYSKVKNTYSFRDFTFNSYQVGDGLAPHTVEYYFSGSAGRSGSDFYLYEDRIDTITPIDPPTYLDLLSGYSLDSRTKVSTPFSFIATKTERVIFSYYQENTFEKLPLRSIDYHHIKIDCVVGKKYTINFSGAVLSTLYCSSIDVLNLIRAVPTTSGKYKFSDYLIGADLKLFEEWSLMIPNVTQPSIPDFPIAVTRTDGRKVYNYHTSPVFLNFNYVTNIIGIVRKLSANNNVWNNDNTNYLDLNFDITHPMFAVDNSRAYNWHIKPVSQGIGTLIMDSPRTIEIHKALQAQRYLSDDGSTEPTGQHTLDWYIRNSASDKITAIWKALGGDKYAINEIDPDKDRITNLGYYIEKIASLLGHRLDANGKFDYQKEKDLYTRKLLNKPKFVNGQYSEAGFAERGLIVPHLPNSYDKDHSLLELYDVVYDIPQLLSARHDQVDKSLGIQHGSEIRVMTEDNRVAKYPNQLALLLDLHSQVSAINNTVDANKIIATITAQEVRELFAGIGIPVSTKYISALASDGKPTGKRLPYFGFQAGKESILNQLTTLKVNLAIVLGTLMPKKQPPKADVFDPFSWLKGK
jgi:hypothetical protein